MAKIWQDIEIEWQGEFYRVRPTMDFINMLEQERGNSISMMFYRLTKGDLPSGRACDVVAKTLRYAGLEKVTAEDVFVETGGGIGVDIIELVQTILVACMPEPKETKSSAASGGGKKKTPARKPSGKKPTGKNSTGSQSAT